MDKFIPSFLRKISIIILMLFITTIYVCKIVAKKPGTTKMDKSFGWVEVWFFTGYYYQNGYYDPPSAYVYDSEGNFYEVDLTIE